MKKEIHVECRATDVNTIFLAFSIPSIRHSHMEELECFPSDMEKQKRRPQTCKSKLVICSFETGKETANTLLHD